MFRHKPARDEQPGPGQGLASASPEQLAEYEALLEACGAGVLLLAPDGIIRRANAVAQELFGREGRAVAGLTLAEATLSDTLARLFADARLTLAPQHAEVRTPRTGSGTLLVSLVPVCVAGRLASVLLVAQNVTELRRLETVRRDFVANVSHELRTPLATIRAMAETLHDGAKDDEEVAGSFLTTIIGETDRLKRIADDLLVLSDAESRSGEDTPYDLSELVRDIVARFAQPATRAGVSLSADIPDGLRARGNPDQVEQVFINLVDNAIKYTPSGGSVTVAGEAAADTVTVRVSDTGIGIMSQDLPRIFERFYRVDKARSRRSGGTGLGLSIVKHIVESHGGSVSVESQFNRGSTFAVLLPRHIGDAE